jgi:uncharacterized protein (TIGR03435 family)
MILNPVRWCGLPGSPFANLRGQGMTLRELSAVLSADRGIARPVVNQTGLTGKFDFELRCVPGPNADTELAANPAADSGPSIFTALQEQLGLKRQRERNRVEFLVIDRIERATEN